jgi:hypothetical protein
MKLPTSNGNDLYQIGNDYPQVASAYFETSSYHDGIYTELKKDLVWDVSGVDGFDDSFFDLKNPEGLNKRILNVPQSAWAVPTSGEDFVGDDISAISAVSATFSPDYAVAELSAFPKA